jgi:hypothetical protein
MLTLGIPGGEKDGKPTSGRVGTDRTPPADGTTGIPISGTCGVLGFGVLMVGVLGKVMLMPGMYTPGIVGKSN